MLEKEHRDRALGWAGVVGKPRWKGSLKMFCLALLPGVELGFRVPLFICSVLMHH